MITFDSIPSLIEAFPTQKSAQIYFAKIRFREGYYCPHCGCTEKIYEFKDGITYKCSICRKKFNCITGTIFEKTKIDLPKWFLAIYLITYHKKGIQTTQLAKDLGVTYKTAWFIGHRVREMLNNKSFNKLKGCVQLDELYYGGRQPNKHRDKKVKGNQGRSTKTKVGVFGMMCGNEVRAFVVPNTKAKTLVPIMLKNIDPDSTVYTDEYRAYSGVKRHFPKHFVVDHGKKMYRDDVTGATTNKMENFWRFFRAGLKGLHHSVTKEHLPRYLREICYRFNLRTMTANDLLILVISGSSGRLTYKELIKEQAWLRRRKLL